jgi:hypothetical protein
MKSAGDVGYILACKSSQCPVQFKVVITQGLSLQEGNETLWVADVEVQGLVTGMDGEFAAHHHAHTRKSTSKNILAKDTSLTSCHKAWLLRNILSAESASTYFTTGIPAVQQMRSANVPGANNLCPSKVSRHLQHARKVNAQEQDIKTFGGLAEFVQSRMMFAEGGGSFHPDLLAMENAIHEPRVIYSHLDEGNIKFVLVWSSVHMLLNLYRSTLPSLPHGGWLGCDTTHGLIYKFGTKEFVLSCFNTMDLQRHSHLEWLICSPLTRRERTMLLDLPPLLLR